MRKGTRSCRECRRRKIKCTWASDVANVCNECTKDHRACVNQGPVSAGIRAGRSQLHLNVRVDRIESIVEQLAKSAETCSTKQTTKSDDLKGQPISSDLHDRKISARSPFYGLFNNAALMEVTNIVIPDLNGDSNLVGNGSPSPADIYHLRSTISSEPNVLDALNITTDWWVAWKHLTWALRYQGATSLRAFVEKQLESTDPVNYSIGLGCVALALQQLRPGKDDIHLWEDVQVVFDRIVAAIDTITLSKYLHDENTVLVALQRAKTHAEGNQLRKCWQHLRLAISIAKETELANPTPSEKDHILLRQQLVGQTHEMDTYLSMVLGFPQATDPNFTDTLAMTVLRDPTSTLNLRMRAFRRAVAIVASRVNDRNAELANASDASIANALQTRLDEIAAYMPSDWWDLSTHWINPDAQEAHEHLMAQMLFWETQVFIHLPHMLVANSIPSVSDNGLLCLQGARQMLFAFSSLRGNPAFSVFVCSCEDFQAVFTSCILLVGLLLQLSQDTLLDNTNLDEDLITLAEVKDIFRYRSNLQGGHISKEGLVVIEELESCLFDDSAGVTKNIILPYFGLIRIESRGRGQTKQLSALDTCVSAALDPPTTHGTSSNGLTPAKINLEPRMDSHSVQLPDHPDVMDQEVDNFDFNAAFSNQGINWDFFLQGNELGRDWQQAWVTA